MPLFSRPRPQATPTQDRLHDALRQLSDALQAHAQERQQAAPSTRSAGTALLCAFGLAVVAGTVFCATHHPRLPAGIRPVRNLDLARFLGKWYEVAHIAQRADRGLQRIQLEFSQPPGGAVQVIRRGFHPVRGEWKVSHGKLVRTMAPDMGAFKLSFLGPFFDGFHVVALDDQYRWAMVIGSSLNDFRILSRTPALPAGTEPHLMQQAQRLGIDPQQVLWVHQDGVNPTGFYG